MVPSRLVLLRHPVFLISVSLSIALFYITLFGLPDASLTTARILSPGKGAETSAAGVQSNETTYTSLQDLCTNTIWQPNLTLHCHSRCGPSSTSICGGLNNARDRLQTCVRLAIDAGATTVLIPSIAARSTERLATVDPSKIPGSGEPVVLCAEAWFSVETLRRVLGTSCPKLKVEAVCQPAGQDVAGMGGEGVHEMPWKTSGEESFDLRPGHTFREAVDRALAEDEVVAGLNPILLQFGDSYMAWNYSFDGERYTVFKDLFRTVEFNADLLALGKRITESPQLREAPYVGVHLRGENDWPVLWGSLGEQTEQYALELVRLRERNAGLRTIYISCGNKTAIQYFRDAVTTLDFLVFDKWDILETTSPEGLGVVEALPFDQQAIVEYVPLLEAKYFLGISSSSMSVVISQARTLDQSGDFLGSHVEKQTAEVGTGGRTLEMRGSEDTRLLVISEIEQ